MKLVKILDNINIPKNKWIPLTPNDLKQVKKDIYNLVKNAYKDIGGHPNLKSPSDIPGDLGDLFTVIDLDNDQDIDAVVVSKKKPAGKKFTAIGHDGSKPAKSSVISQQVSKLKTKGYYIEVSDKIFDILKAKGIPIIDDEAVVRKVLKDKEIKWNGDGTYTRNIGGTPKTKILMGKPNI
jgi:hypothetical protein